MSISSTIATWQCPVRPYSVGSGTLTSANPLDKALVTPIITATHTTWNV